MARSNGRKPPLLASDGFLWAQVQKLLKQKYCCGADRGHAAARMCPDDLSMRVSHETIYKALYAMPRGELRKELLATLRQARKARRPRARGEDRRGEILNMFSIHQRQDELDLVAWALNTRPRKSLGFKCPAELSLPDTFNADEYYSRLVLLHT